MRFVVLQERKGSNDQNEYWRYEEDHYEQGCFGPFSSYLSQARHLLGRLVVTGLHKTLSEADGR